VRGGEAGKARSSLVNSDKVERDLAFDRQKQRVMKDFVACMQSASEHRIVLSDRIGSRCSSNICVGVSMRDLVSGPLIDCYS